MVCLINVCGIRETSCNQREIPKTKLGLIRPDVSGVHNKGRHLAEQLQACGPLGSQEGKYK